jgi:hypothetical protein
MFCLRIFFEHRKGGKDRKDWDLIILRSIIKEF